MIKGLPLSSCLALIVDLENSRQMTEGAEARKEIQETLAGINETYPSLFLIVHIFTDCYLQSPSLAARKQGKGRALCLHLLLDAGLMLFCALALSWRGAARTPAAAAAFSLSALHAAADIVKLRLIEANRRKSQLCRILSDRHTLQRSFSSGILFADYPYFVRRKP